MPEPYRVRLEEPCKEFLQASGSALAAERCHPPGPRAAQRWRLGEVVAKHGFKEFYNGL